MAEIQSTSALCHSPTCSRLRDFDLGYGEVSHTIVTKNSPSTLKGDGADIRVE